MALSLSSRCQWQKDMEGLVGDEWGRASQNIWIGCRIIQQRIDNGKIKESPTFHIFIIQRDNQAAGTIIKRTLDRFPYPKWSRFKFSALGASKKIEIKIYNNNQFPRTALRTFLRFLRCSSLETTEMRLEVRMALMLAPLRQYLAHLLKIQQSQPTERKSSCSTFSFISQRYSLNSSSVKNFMNMETFTYFLPLLALMKRMVMQKMDKIFQISEGVFPIRAAHFSTILSDFYRLLKKEQNWLIMFDQLFFLALRISFSRVFSILLFCLRGAVWPLGGSCRGQSLGTQVGSWPTGSQVAQRSFWRRVCVQFEEGYNSSDAEQKLPKF